MQQRAATRPVGALIDELLAHAGDGPEGAELLSELREMQTVLDVQHDGAHYLLLRGPPPHARREVTLSSRELEIARMIAGGHTNRTIAAVLEISPWTVSTHLRRIFAKLDVRSRPAMVAQLVASGLLVDRAGATPAGSRRAAAR